jgi:hypothetical protein
MPRLFHLATKLRGVAAGGGGSSAKLLAPAPAPPPAGPTPPPRSYRCVKAVDMREGPEPKAPKLGKVAVVWSPPNALSLNAFDSSAAAAEWRPAMPEFVRCHRPVGCVVC